MKANKLLELIAQLEAKIPMREKINLEVSAVNVGWHIEHILMATLIVCEQLIRSDPGKYKWKFNTNRLIVFGLNRIPRGKGQAPKLVQPNKKASEARMRKYVELVNEKISIINGLSNNNFIQHPNLGILNRTSGVRFMCIHLRHHLSIINDILKPEHKN